MGGREVVGWGMGGVECSKWAVEKWWGGVWVECSKQSFAVLCTSCTTDSDQPPNQRSTAMWRVNKYSFICAASQRCSRSAVLKKRSARASFLHFVCVECCSFSSVSYYSQSLRRSRLF